MKSAPASRTPVMDTIIGRLALVLITCQLTISPMMLQTFGWNYEALGGSAFERLHPATYLLLLLFMIVALRDGNPIASIYSAFARDMRLTLFFLVWLFVLIHGALNQKLPATALSDTFLMPMLVLVIFRRLDGLTRQRMERIVHIVFLANALIGLAEMLLGFRLVVYHAGGIIITDDWRSTALLGHPLANALMTGCYIILLLLRGGHLLKGIPRVMMIGLQYASMIAFGGRASLVLLLAFSGAYAAYATYRFLAGNRVPLGQLAAIGLASPLLVGAGGILIQIGFFDKFLQRFSEDNGSTNARIVMFDLFNGFTWPEILLGPNQDFLTYFVHINRLEFGIESVWVAFSLYYGIIPGILFFSGFFLFLGSVVSECKSRAWAVFTYFMLINTTFLGIAGKSLNVTTLCLLAMLLLPRWPTQAAPYRAPVPSPLDRPAYP
ncbi:hypothetical protein MCEMSEM23_00559 [Rhabdaerophilaceae bacterium]